MTVYRHYVIREHRPEIGLEHMVRYACICGWRSRWWDKATTPPLDAQEHPHRMLAPWR